MYNTVEQILINWNLWSDHICTYWVLLLLCFYKHRSELYFYSNNHNNFDLYPMLSLFRIQITVENKITIQPP